MSIGMILLIGVTVLIFMGLAERVLDRLRLNDKAAIVIIIAIVLSTIFIPDIDITERISVNVAGFLIPLGLVIYLFVKAETTKERMRAIIAAIVAGAVIYAVQRYVLPAEPEAQLIDPNYVYPVLAGLTAYLIGRSRRAAFIAGIGGVIISDVIQLVLNTINNIPSPTRFGGAGGADTTVIAGIVAVLIAEIVGETREKLQGGTEKKNMHFEKGHFVSTLGQKEDKAPENKKEKDSQNNRIGDDENDK
ncbi:YphA family membrane protein [Alkaliphilus peptidifermentans]|uniref:DUF1614 domain-containing protein n=1 Tax=Alkaliphilus peptidifermentans DSM 18978 TaxID=1120976 RepID=A0A1G5BCC3_9FIRM|nr:DUF1614 domain-containing protein [Alkaliphilus peptidifermentans]SCX87804.1 Protein of unknown function [Alkaliphilus peptidifermentans DSM 18978]